MLSIDFSRCHVVLHVPHALLLGKCVPARNFSGRLQLISGASRASGPCLGRCQKENCCLMGQPFKKINLILNAKHVKVLICYLIGMKNVAMKYLELWFCSLWCHDFHFYRILYRSVIRHLTDLLGFCFLSLPLLTYESGQLFLLIVCYIILTIKMR